MFENTAVLFQQVFDIYHVAFDWFLLWGPIVLGVTFANMWMYTVRRRYIANIQWTMLELKVPRDVKKTPVAMEVALHAFYQTSQGKWPDWVFKGRVRNWFSLEMVSLEGAVKFFLRIPTSYKDAIEAQLYAQYPSMEIYEVPDYTKYVNYGEEGSDWNIFGLEFKLGNEDAFPIKTYIDYKIDREGIKEEEKTDPLTGSIEYLGSLGKGEQAWLQILIKTPEKRYKKPGTWFGKRDWKAVGTELVEKIIKDARKRTAAPGSSPTGPVLLSKLEEGQIAALDRSLSKLGFDCGIRGIYLGKGSAFKDSRIDGLAGIFRQFSGGSNYFEGTRPTKFNYPWQDYKGIRKFRLKKKMFSAYKRRQYFYPPHKRVPFVLTVEELATIYHFPGDVAETPTFGRIESRKGEPPAYLPTSS